MAQETWGLKLDSDLKEKVQEIIKSDFDSSKEFMEQLVSMYELHQLKQGDNILTQEVDELEALTRRINGIFINANAKINTMLLDKDSKLEQQTELKQRLIEKLQNDIAKLEEDNAKIGDMNDSLVNLNNECNEQVNQLTKSTSTLEYLVAEYKEKNDTLTGLLSEYKEDRERNKELVSQNKQLQDKLNELNIAATAQAKQILEADAKLNEREQKHVISLQEINEKHQNNLQEIIERHTEELTTTKTRVEIETNRRVLDLQTGYQSKIQTLQDKHNTEIQQNQSKMQALQDKYNAEIEQYQSKYKELLESMEKQESNRRKAMKTKTESDEK